MYDREQNELSRIEITVDDPAKVDATAEALRRMLQSSHKEADYVVDIVR